MNKITFFKNALSTMVLFFSIMLSAQSASKEPADIVLAESAPHLSWIQRSDASENVFQGEKFKYDLVKNNEHIQKWVDQYPSEVTSYKQAIEFFFNETSANNFSTDYENFDKPFDEWTTVIDSSNIQTSYMLGTCDNQPYLFLKIKNNNNFKLKFLCI
jgi:hypothetical protein